MFPSHCWQLLALHHNSWEPLLHVLGNSLFTLGLIDQLRLAYFYGQWIYPPILLLGSFLHTVKENTLAGYINFTLGIAYRYLIAGCDLVRFNVVLFYVEVVVRLLHMKSYEKFGYLKALVDYARFFLSYQCSGLCLVVRVVECVFICWKSEGDWFTFETYFLIPLALLFVTFFKVVWSIFRPSFLENWTCSICLDSNDTALYCLPCFHFYHKECLERVSVKLCPLCRRGFEEEEPVSIIFGLLESSQ